MPWRRNAVLGTVALAAASFLCTSAAGAAIPGDAPTYIALGGSGSVGVQPTLATPKGQPTDSGYANDIAASLRSRWPDLQLVQFGCSGETTNAMLFGNTHCHYFLGSQLATALSFLSLHRVNLVTVDIGFNDLDHCITGLSIDEACAVRATSMVRLQLVQILTLLRGAAAPDTRFVGIGHFDPFLGRYFQGAAGRVFAEASVGVIEHLNAAMDSAYDEFGIPMTDVASAFDMTDTTPTSVAGLGIVPKNVARTCQLTWMCSPGPLGPNRHPNDYGYRVIGDSVTDLLANH
jgi:lysophospholipase L1-like esterase